MRIPGSTWQVGAAVLLMMALASWPGQALRLTAEEPVTPAGAVTRLKVGNTTFVSNPEAALPISASRRSALASGQTPFAAVLSCADSRVPPEVVFHTGLGDLFVVRAAGHVADKSILASLEYAAEHLHVPLVVVMGHEACGAVQAAAETPAAKSLGPNLDYMLKAIRPSVTASASAPDDLRIRAAILRNVEHSINDLIAGSTILRELAEIGKLGFIGAYYELGTGRAHFSEPAAIGPAAAVANTRSPRSAH
jgi:carbonic anhydrase